MQIVIDIPESEYYWIMGLNEEQRYYAQSLISKGIVLPKGHGRLIDADELIEHAWRDRLDSRELIAEMIENAPTIVPR